MKFLLLTHLVLSVFGAVFLGLFMDWSTAFSFVAGAGLMLGNFAFHALVWPFFLPKKLFALSIGVIVFKFAILAWILNIVATGNTLQAGWFAVGICTVVVTAVITAFREAAQFHT